MSRTVALVLHADSLVLFNKLAREIPVWIADTLPHASLKQASGEGLALTWFPLRDNEELERAAIRIIYSLDQHYDALSQNNGYDALWVVGIPYKSSYLTELMPLGFLHLEPAEGGFIAIK